MKKNVKGVGRESQNIDLEPKGDYYFLGIGVSKYKNESVPNLYNPAKELEAISEILFEKYSFNKNEKYSKILLDEEATLDNFFNSIAEIFQNIKNNDSLLIYFTGHGIDGFWIPYDGDKDIWYRTYISLDILKKQIAEKLKARSIFIICDCCYSATLIQIQIYRGDIKPREHISIARQALCSCWADAEALEGNEGLFSPFANAVIDTLNTNSKQQLNAAFFYAEVNEKTKSLTKKAQNPVFGEIPDCGDKKGQFYFLLKEHKNEPLLETKQDIKNTLKELAWYLAYNYANISFGNRYMDQKSNLDKKQQDEIFTEKHLNTKRCRNIVIVGAGMTYDAFNVLPFGDEMVNQIKNILEKNPETALNHKNQEKLKWEYNQRKGFEDKLEILSKAEYFKADEVNQVLKDIYNIRFRPNLSFEILSHLLKHGFIDAIINFNFDELLDKAIESEIGPGTYHKVISESDCMPISEITVDGRIKVPVYIKPHGTASNRNSLTLDRKILPGVQKLMQNLLHGYIDEENEIDRVEIVNLICIGFSMQNQTLNSFIQDAEERIQFNIFHINTSDIKNQIALDSIKRKKGFQDNLYQETINRIIDITEVKMLKELPYKTNPVSIALYELWRQVEGFFKHPYYIRDICRHEIIASLFYNPDTQLHESYKDLHKEVNRLYFFDRTVIELAIIICRNKGLVDPKQITVDKFGIYFKKYKEYSSKELYGKNDIPFTLYDFLRHIFRMREHLSFSGNLYNPLDPTYTKNDLLGSEGNEINRFMINYPILLEAMKEVLLLEKNEKIRYKNKKIIGSEGKRREIVNIENHILIREFYKNLPLLMLFRMVDGIRTELFLHREKSRVDKKEIDKEYAREVPYEYKHTILPRAIGENPELAKHLYYCFKKIYDRQLYDIHPKFHDPQLFIFDSFDRNNILNTDISLLYEFMKMFKEFDKWDAMLIVSERGRFITEFAIDNLSERDKNKLSQKKIINICCHDIMKTQMRDMRNNDRGLEERYKRIILKIGSNNNNCLKDMEVLSLPYSSYEHHMCIFMKKPENNKEITNTAELYKYLEYNVSALYYHHRSLVHKINPILLRLDKDKANDNIYRKKLALDLKKLLETYYVLTTEARFFKENRFQLPIVHRPSPYIKDFCDKWDEEIYKFINKLFM